jgi:hypothetical protein
MRYRVANSNMKGTTVFEFNTDPRYYHEKVFQQFCQTFVELWKRDGSEPLTDDIHRKLNRAGIYLSVNHHQYSFVGDWRNVRPNDIVYHGAVAGGTGGTSTLRRRQYR